MRLINCPRCGDRSYEKLRSHDHCINCNYSSEFEKECNPSIPTWALEAVADESDSISDLIHEAEKLLEPKQENVA